MCKNMLLKRKCFELNCIRFCLGGILPGHVSVCLPVPVGLFLRWLAWVWEQKSQPLDPACVSQGLSDSTAPTKHKANRHLLIWCEIKAYKKHTIRICHTFPSSFKQFNACRICLPKIQKYFYSLSWVVMLLPGRIQVWSIEIEQGKFPRTRQVLGVHGDQKCLSSADYRHLLYTVKQFKLKALQWCIYKLICQKCAVNTLCLETIVYVHT